MRDGIIQNKISSEFGVVLCFEIEVAGLINSFPYLIIHRIYDYANLYKNKRWQLYTARTTAVYAKELLLIIPAADIVKIQMVNKAI